jgi:hypothetical protein
VTGRPSASIVRRWSAQAEWFAGPCIESLEANFERHDRAGERFAARGVGHHAAIPRLRADHHRPLPVLGMIALFAARVEGIEIDVGDPAVTSGVRGTYGKNSLAADGFSAYYVSRGTRTTIKIKA